MFEIYFLLYEENNPASAANVSDWGFSWGKFTGCCSILKLNLELRIERWLEIIVNTSRNPNFWLPDFWRLLIYFRNIFHVRKVRTSLKWISYSSKIPIGRFVPVRIIAPFFLETRSKTKKNSCCSLRWSQN